jgi:hypothetical protein
LGVDSVNIRQNLFATGIFRAFSAVTLLAFHLGRCPRLLHFAPLALRAGLSAPMRYVCTLRLPNLVKRSPSGNYPTVAASHVEVVNRPSDQTGERLVGDAILVFPEPK